MIAILLLATIAALLLLIADTALGRPDRAGCHPTRGECLAARLTVGRLVLTVGVAAALPLFGLVQLARWGAGALSGQATLRPAVAIA
jgi:hypothetical protein